MAFMCPAKESVEKRQQLLAELKGLVKEMEEEPPVSCVPCCYRPCLPAAAANPPNVMVCYKVADDEAAGGNGSGRKAGGGGAVAVADRKHHDEEEQLRMRSCKSCELRASNLYRMCDCEKRNGLQDDCPRSECRGSDRCLTDPPTCCPSQYSGAKHLMVKMERMKRRMEARAGGGGGAIVGSEAAEGEAGGAAASTTKTERYYCYPAMVTPDSVCCPCCPGAC